MKNIMTNLGKIIFTCIMASNMLHAKLNVFVDTDKVTIGETVRLGITAEGEKVVPPDIASICGEEITATSTSTSVQGINGVFTKKQTFEYSFVPTKSCTIEPIAVLVDGVKEMTKPVDITVSPVKVTKNSRFILQLESNKKRVYVGEPFTLTVIFKQKHGANAVDSKFTLPPMKNFWVKEESEGRKFEEGGYTVQRLSYVLAPQKSGYHTIKPARIEIAARSQRQDTWGQWFATLKWRTYFSNELEMEVLPLPDNLSIVGTFTIDAEVDTTEVNASDAVNVTVTIKGSGNFEDIQGFKPKITGVGVFEEEPTTKAYIEHGEYKGVWSQNIALVPTRDVTIAPFTLRYFDLEHNRSKTIQTRPITIHVKNSAPKETPEPLKIQRASVPQTQEVQDHDAPATASGGSFTWGLGLGVFLGVLLGLLPWRIWLRRRKRAAVPMHYKNERDMLGILLNHLDDPDAAAMASKLEAKLYEGRSVSIDPKELKALYKKYM